jgi:class 3 adenylate cyclase
MPLVCQQCEAESPPGFRFCGHCGAPLPSACPACGTTVPPGFRFCGYCGEPLRPAAPAAPGEPLPEPSQTRGYGAPHTPDAVQPPTASRQPSAVIPPRSPISEAEGRAGAARSEQRRRVAILFADLVGSTALADRTEAEVAYRVVSGFLEGLGQVVTEAGGYVVKTLGDGLMALFGAPTAHGDDPVRAARAAMGMQTWMGEYGEQVEAQYGIPLRLRLGINYGSVVAAPISAGGRPTYDVLGDAVNIAQRVESAAEPGAVCVSEPFYRITRAAFEYREMGAAQLKGKREPLLLYQLVREREEIDRRGLTAASLDGALPLVGREAELGRLHAAAQQVARGEGGIVAVAGGLGLGKTRLLDELKEELVALGIPHLRAAAAEGAQSVPLSLWRTWLLQLLPVDPAMSHAEAAASIYGVIRDSEQAAWVEWLAALAVDPQRFISLDADARARAAREALRTLLALWQQGRPAALLVDEAEVLDSLSLQLLREFSAEGGFPLLVALAGRAQRAPSPEFPPPGVETISLEPLSVNAAAALLDQALQRAQPAPSLQDPRADPALRAAMVARAGGNPLFLELMAQAAGEVDDPAAALASVPDTLYGLVQAQLDSLSAADRRLIEPAAVLGKSFAERWLAALCNGKLAAPMRAAASTAYPPPHPSPMRAATSADYSPPHHSPPWYALETAGLLLEQRPPPLRELAFRHGAVQEVLYEGLLQAQCCQYHQRAAAIIAAEAAAQPELAAGVAWHWKSAGEREPALTWTLRAAEHAASLYAGQEAERLYKEALELAEQIDSPERIARAAAGLAELAAHRGEFPLALEYYQRAEQQFEALDAVRCSLEEIHYVLRAAIARGQARVQALTGAPAAAAPLLERALHLLAAPPLSCPDCPLTDAIREYARCLNEQAHVLCDLGRLEAALDAGRQAQQLADTRSWPSEAAAAGAALGRIYQLLGDGPAAQRELRRAAQVAESCSDWQSAAACWITLGLALQSAGCFRDATATLQVALEAAVRIDDAEKVALAHLNLGLVRLNQGDWTAAETAFRAALDRFRPMEHHLGAVISLANLADALRWTGRAPEAAAALDEAEAHQKRVDAPYLHAHLLAVRAELGLALGDPQQAARLSRWALELAQESGYQTVVNSSRLALGRALRHLGDAPGAARELEAAAAGFDSAGEALNGALARAELAAALAARGERQHAQALYQAAVDAIRQLAADPWLEQLPLIS